MTSPTPNDASNFESDLSSLLNRYCAESPSGTPDFILASFLTHVLREFNEAVSRRAQWRGESCELPALDAITPTKES